MIMKYSRGDLFVLIEDVAGFSSLFQEPIYSAIGSFPEFSRLLKFCTVHFTLYIIHYYCTPKFYKYQLCRK